MTVTNLDNISNSYYNKLGNPNGIQGSYSTTPGSPGFTSWLESTLGSTNILSLSSIYYFILPGLAWENIQPSAGVSTTRYRFSSSFFAGNNYRNIAITNTTNIISGSVSAIKSFTYDNTLCLKVYSNGPANGNSGVVFGLKGSQSLLIMWTTDKTLIEPTWNQFEWEYFGWLLDPLYTGNEREKTLIYMYGSIRNETNQLRIFYPSDLQPSSTYPWGNGVSTFGYSMNCQVPKPEANVTDMIIRTDDQYNRALGRVQNMLVCKTPHPVGTVVQLDVDPDGSTNNKWLSIYRSHDWGCILTRIWVSGI